MNSKELCTALMHANSATEVVEMLSSAGYWDSPECWRPFSDTENNYGSIGNQQSDAVAALVEKLINSIDARLMGLAAEQALDLEDPSAPKNMREAIATLVEGKKAPLNEAAGNIYYWNEDQIREEAKNISIFATGAKPGDGMNPCLTISDRGEGQTPDRIPHTLMASGKSNKIRIPFVQGKFNMGGTGVFRFCSDEHRLNLQLVVTRRNPRLVSQNGSPRDNEWGFTILRRVVLDGMKSSMFEYLAPVEHVDAEPTKRGVLSFNSDEYEIFPSDDKERPIAYGKSSEYGTLIKLYEYAIKSRTNVTFKGSKGESLKVKIEEMLPEAALPIQIAECRDYGGRDRRSLEDEILGTVTQLRNMDYETKQERLENIDPITGMITYSGSRLPVQIYVYKEDVEASRYNPDGIYFTVNGQTHAHEPNRFFNKVKLSYIKNSLFVVVDCSTMTNSDRESIFMNSRDRMSDGPESQELKNHLEKFLREEPLLQELNKRRQEERLKRDLDDQRPLEETLKRLLKENPLLANLLPFGERIPTGFPGKGTVHTKIKDFVGKRTPTFFRFKGDRDQIERELPLNQNSRIFFETDARNDYFSRKSTAGEFTIDAYNEDGKRIPIDYRVGNLLDGQMTVVLEVDSRRISVGAILDIKFSITDDDQIRPFENVLKIKLTPPVEPGKAGKRSSNPKEKSTEPDKGELKSAGLPNITAVEEADWNRENYTASTAVTIKANPDGVGFDFFYNKDNKDLKYQQSLLKQDAKILDHQYKIGLMLVSLALIDASKKERDVEEAILSPDVVEELVEEVTEAISPYWLSIMEALSGLKFDQVDSE